MSGKLLKAARRDLRNFTSTGGFEEDIEMINPDGSVIINFKNLHTKHHLKFDSEGNTINSMTASITVLDSVLIELNYPYRNSKGKVDFKGHKVNVSDSVSVRKYVVNEFIPSDTFGMYKLILGNQL